MTARFKVTALAIVVIVAAIAAGAALTVTHDTSDGHAAPATGRPRGSRLSQSATPSQVAPPPGPCAGSGPAVDVHTVTLVSRSVRWVFAPDLVVGPRTGRATIAFAAAPRGTPVTSVWSKGVPGSRVTPQRISSGEKGWFPLPYNGEFEVLERPDSLGVDAAGNQTALWREQTPAIKFRGLTSDREVDHGRVMTATRPAGGTWSRPTVLDSRLEYTSETHLAVNGAGAAVAVWVHDRYVDPEHGTRDISLHASYRSSPTGSWTIPFLVARDRQGSSDRDFAYSYVPQVGIDGAGNVVVIYERHRGRGAWVQRRDASTGTWAPAIRLSAGSPDDPGTSLAVSADGTATASLLKYVRRKDVLVWLTARMRANGTWRTPVRVPVDPDTTAPEGIAVDGHGRALAVWRNKSNNNLMVMRSRADGSWGRSTVLARAQRRPFGYLGVVRIAMNGRGDAFTAWETGPGVHAYLNGRYQQVGKPWTPVHRLTPANNGPDEYAAAIGEHGEAGVTWTRASPGNDEDPEYSGPARTVWARRVTPCP